MIDTLEGEVWKDIDGYEGLYSVSNMGRVLSKEHKSTYLSRGREVVRTYPERLIYGEGSKSKYKYNNIVFSRMVGGKQVIERRYLSHIVATAFVDNPYNYKYVNHIDGDYRNNRADNLMWVQFHDTNAGLPKRPVYCRTDDIKFKSVAECSRYYNINKSTLTLHLKNGAPIDNRLFEYVE